MPRCEALYVLLRGWVESLPRRGMLGWIWADFKDSVEDKMGVSGKVQRSGFAGERRSSVMSEFSPFGAEMRDMELATTRSRIKARRHPRRLCRSHLPAVRAVSGVSVGVGNGVKIGEKTEFCGRYPAMLTTVRTKQGSSPGKETMMSKKEKFPLYLSPEKKPSWSADIRKMEAGVSPPSLSGR